MIAFFHEYVYIPIYNLLIFLVGHLPGADVGLAVVLVTVAVKTLILPLSLSALKTQKAMKRIEPQLKEIKEKHKDDRETLAKEMLALYKEHDIRPFSSMFAMLIQIPILISLFFVFQKEPIDHANVELLYSFVTDPGAFSPYFLGLFLIAGQNLWLAIGAGIAQYFQAVYTFPVTKRAKGETPESMSEEFTRMMSLQMRYMFPFLIGAIAYSSGAIALYFITSSLYAIAQEYLSRKLHLKQDPQTI